MTPLLAAHVQALEDEIRVYEQSRRIYLSPSERLRRIQALRAVIAEITRLAARDDEPRVVADEPEGVR
jgi:hypothetical protein